jgi:transposase
VGKDSGEGYQEFLTRLAEESGIETPAREDLAKLDKTRKNKASNDDWERPHDPDAKITKLKDGRTHLAHKAEHAVDLDSGAILAVTLQPADRGDTTSLGQTLEQAGDSLVDAVAQAPDGNISGCALTEVVADKGYHSNEVMRAQRENGVRTYQPVVKVGPASQKRRFRPRQVSRYRSQWTSATGCYVAEPGRGRRDWAGKTAERDAVYANRRRYRGRRGRRLMRKRGELIERSFAHCYDTGGMRRTHLRRHENILKRLLIHVAGFNLSLILRQVLGLGTARGLQGLAARVSGFWEGFWTHIRPVIRPVALLDGSSRQWRDCQLRAA